MAETHISDAATRGFAGAANYEAYRPSFPDEAVEKLLKALEVEGVRGAKIVDLGAGTGKLTEILSRRPENYEIVAVEPHDGMRKELENKKLKNVTVVKAVSSSMPQLETESFAALVAAQAFHWFSNMESLKEIHRILKPTGVFGMIWNIDDFNSPQSWKIRDGWGRKMRDLVWTFEDEVPRFRHEKWRKVLDEQPRPAPLLFGDSGPLFSLPLGEDRIPYEAWLSKDMIWNRFSTLSQIAVLKDDELESVKRQFDEAIEGPENDVDKEGRVALYGSTFFAWTTRIPGEPLRSGG